MRNTVTNTAKRDLSFGNVVELETSVTGSAVVNDAIMVAGFKMFIDVTAGADADTVLVVAPFDLDLIGGSVTADVTVTAGMATVKNGADVVFTGVAQAVAKAKTAVVEVDSSKNSFSEGDNITILLAKDTQDGVIELVAIPT